MTTWFHYVRHADVETFEAKGWRVVNSSMGHHGAYSVLMQWEGFGEPA